MKHLCLLFLVFIPSLARPQPGLIDELNQNLIPIKTFAPDDSFSDMQGLKKAFTNTRIIALGEATHGTKEFFVYKHRMLRFLVTQMGYKIFVIEGDFSGAKLVNDYVTSGTGTLYEALQAMEVGFWINQDFMDMIEWIKAYNLQCRPGDKIKFYGCDMQYPITVLHELIHSSFKLQHPLSAACLEGLNILINNIGYRKLSDQETLKVKNAISEIRLDKTLKMDAAEQQFYLQEIRTVEQLLEFESENHGNKQFEMRDKFMAENCTWIYNHEDHAKTVIWAHNGHIAKYSTVAQSQPMGHYLAEQFGDQYYPVGFGFNSGTVRAASIPSTGTKSVFNVPPVKIKNSFDYIFSECNQPNFFLDFKMASASTKIRDFLNERYFSRSIGSSYSDAKFGKGKDIHEPLISLYDGIIFIRTTNAALPEIYKTNY